MRFYCSTILLSATALVYGCSDKPQEKQVFPVHGRVTFKNQPMANAVIVFHNADASDRTTPSHATADQDGRYKLHTYRVDDGAPAGECIVTISWPGKTAQKKSKISLDADDTSGIRLGDRLEGQYSTVGKSPIRATVKPEINEININLPLQ